MNIGTRLGPASLQGCAMHSSLLPRLQAENEQVPLCNSGHLNVFYETPRYEEYLSWSSTFSTVKKDLIALLFPGSRWACRFSWRQTSYLLACENVRFSSLFAAGDVSRGGNAKHETSPAAQREEKRMFSQAIVSHKVVKQKAWSGEKNNCQFAADVSAMSSFMIVTYVIA